MRSGVCSVQQTLTAEAASVLKHALGLARRRGHAQLTPLHVAATLLSHPAALLRRACISTAASGSSASSQCRALELCFGVALNRLPAGPGPTLSNALVAALKRAQAHHRRCASEPAQPILLPRVEPDQLLLSILDDPSISRVLREAGFSSSAVKSAVESHSARIFHLSPPPPPLGFTLHANPMSVHDSRITLSQLVPETKPLITISNRDNSNNIVHEYQSQSNNNNNLSNNYYTKLSCCSECALNCEKEAELMRTGNQKLPSWLKPHGTETPQKDKELVELRKKWSRLCHSLHQGRNTQNDHLSYYYPWWPQNNNNTTSSSSFSSTSSITFAAVDPSLLRRRPQTSRTIDFGRPVPTPGMPSLDFLRSRETGEDDKITTLALGHDDPLSPDFEAMSRILKENVPWQSEAIPSVVRAVTAHGSNTTWLLIRGNDVVAKTRLARALAESVNGSADSLLRLHAGRRRGCGDPTAALEKALRSDGGGGGGERLVVLVEDVGSAEPRLVKLIAEGLSGSRRAVFILTTEEDSAPREGRSGGEVIRMRLDVGGPEAGPGSGLALGRKRKRGINALDLNVEACRAEDEDGNEEISPNSSDLTRDTSTASAGPGPGPGPFLETIEDVFVFERSPARDREAKEVFEAEMARCFGEYSASFNVDEGVLEEVSIGCGFFTNSLFEDWVRGVLKNALKTVRVRAKEKGFGGGVVVRLCLGGAKDEGIDLVDGFMGSCLPNKILITYKD